MLVNLLGTTELATGGERREVGARKVRTLLALLALSPGRPVTCEELTDELWGRREIANTRNALQANIVRLRKLVEDLTGRRGDEMVRTVDSGYLLDVAPEEVDTERFLELARRGSALGETRPQEAVAPLRQALLQWRGPALLDVQDGDRCRRAATYLDERWLTVQEDLISARLAVGDHRGVVHELEQLVMEHPGRERLSEQLMLALYRTGRQSQAVTVFRSTSDWLRDELGLSPGRSLRGIYQAILVQDAVLD